MVVVFLLAKKEYLKFLLNNMKKEPISKEFNIFNFVNESLKYNMAFYSFKVPKIEFFGVDNKKLFKKANKIYLEKFKLN